MPGPASERPRAHRLTDIEPQAAKELGNNKTDDLSTPGSSGVNMGSIARFPKLDECAHFHYEHVELGALEVSVSEDPNDDTYDIRVTSGDACWTLQRSYENFVMFDKQLHRCIFDRKFSSLTELPDEQPNEAADLLKDYLSRFSQLSHEGLNCGPVLNWLQLDNRGRRILVPEADSCPINTPAVAAAYAVRPYAAQAQDEISFQMEEIPGKRANTSRYVFEGYEYHIDTTSPDIYRCATRASTGCRGTARVDAHGRVNVYKPHEGHAPNATIVQEAAMRREMIESATRTNEDLKYIFDAVCRRNPDIAAKFSFNNMKSAMQRARGKLRPIIPGSLRELAAALITYAPTQQMYRGIVEADDGSVALLFASEQIMVALAAAHEIYIDGTFKVAPYHPPVAQLYTVHIRIMDTGIAAVYALCSAKTRSLYSAIFSKIADLVPNLVRNLRFVLGDYERAAMGAIREVFPAASIQGCWFHFNQALLRRWRRLGLTDVQSSVLPMAMALPLAPSERFEEGLHILADMADEVAVQHPAILQFMQYLRRQWGPLAEIVSVHNCPVRTNNLVESFHNEAKRKLGGLHPNVWKFIEHLVELIENQELDLQRVQNGDRARRPRTLRNMRKDILIRDAQHDLSVGRYTLLEFLRRCATRTNNIQVGRDDEEGEDVAELVEPGAMAPGDAQPEEPNQHGGRHGRGVRPRRVRNDPEARAGADAPPVPRGQRRGRGRRQVVLPVPEAAEPDIDNPPPAEPEAEREAERDSDGEIPPNSCRVCLLAPATHAFIPCGHRCCCAACAERIAVRCPLCRTEFVGDMISVIDMPPPGESTWWRGKHGFAVGFFPAECVAVIGDKVPRHLTVSTTVRSRLPVKPVLRKHGKLIAFFRSFILNRPSRRRLKQSGILRERVFGCDLGEHLLNSGQDVPTVLTCCAKFIETHGLVDGIYRLSGVTSNIQRLRHAFDEDRVPALHSDESILQDIHSVASLLKMYFRELPNPLCTYQLYSAFVGAVQAESDSERLRHMREAVRKLPPPHYRTLEYLMRHLAKVAACGKETGMTSRNVAIVWAPNLLRCKELEVGGVAALQGVGVQAVVTEFLVCYAELIFGDGPVGRPKSLAITTPARLLSLEEARSRVLRGESDYIEVGAGPAGLPLHYHTVIELPRKRHGSKRSPSLNWRALFTRGGLGARGKTRQARTPPQVEVPSSLNSLRRLRPVKSADSLDGEDSLGPLLGPPPVRPCGHSRSISHDSYFDHLADAPSANSPLDLSEIQLNFDLEEREMRMFSEDEGNPVTSVEASPRRQRPGEPQCLPVTGGSKRKRSRLEERLHCDVELRFIDSQSPDQVMVSADVHGTETPSPLPTPGYLPLLSEASTPLTPLTLPGTPPSVSPIPSNSPRISFRSFTLPLEIGGDEDSGSQERLKRLTASSDMTSDSSHRLFGNFEKDNNITVNKFSEIISTPASDQDMTPCERATPTYDRLTESYDSRITASSDGQEISEELCHQVLDSPDEEMTPCEKITTITTPRDDNSRTSYDGVTLPSNEALEPSLSCEKILPLSPAKSPSDSLTSVETRDDSSPDRSCCENISRSTSLGSQGQGLLPETLKTLESEPGKLHLDNSDLDSPMSCEQALDDLPDSGFVICDASDRLLSTTDPPAISNPNDEWVMVERTSESGLSPTTVSGELTDLLQETLDPALATDGPPARSLSENVSRTSLDITMGSTAGTDLDNSCIGGSELTDSPVAAGGGQSMEPKNPLTEREKEIMEHDEGLVFVSDDKRREEKENERDKEREENLGDISNGQQSPVIEIVYTKKRPSNRNSKPHETHFDDPESFSQNQSAVEDENYRNRTGSKGPNNEREDFKSRLIATEESNDRRSASFNGKPPEDLRLSYGDNEGVAKKSRNSMTELEVFIPSESAAEPCEVAHAPEGASEAPSLDSSCSFSNASSPVDDSVVLRDTAAILEELALQRLSGEAPITPRRRYDSEVTKDRRSFDSEIGREIVRERKMRQELDSARGKSEEPPANGAQHLPPCLRARQARATRAALSRSLDEAKFNRMTGGASSLSTRDTSEDSQHSSTPNVGAQSSVTSGNNEGRNSRKNFGGIDLGDPRCRERIERYKEERRTFLRDKYRSESFRGARSRPDDEGEQALLARLKQRASRPSLH